MIFLETKASNFSLVLKDQLKDLAHGESLVYFDTAVVLKTGQIQGLVDFSKKPGFVLPINFHNFTCFTDANTFRWFNEDVSKYLPLGSHIHAAAIVATKNVISSLIMKAWVTCALDVNCISPEGSRLAPCCGCHRYDQSALQIILNHFFLFPSDFTNFFPAYGIHIENNQFYTFPDNRPN